MTRRKLKVISAVSVAVRSVQSYGLVTLPHVLLWTGAWGPSVPRTCVFSKIAGTATAELFPVCFGWRSENNEEGKKMQGSNVVEGFGLTGQAERLLALPGPFHISNII